MARLFWKLQQGLDAVSYTHLDVYKRQERVRLQNSGKFDEIYIMIADAQALTDNADNPEKVRQNILQVALDYLAVGIDPAKAHIFIQSMVPELTELSFCLLYTSRCV